jgi:hypothetical protein
MARRVGRVIFPAHLPVNGEDRRSVHLVLIYAYLDPGTGSLIIQGLIAAAISVPFLLRSKITAALRRIRRRD